MRCVRYVCCIFIILMFSIPYEFVCSVYVLPVNGVNSAVFNLLILFCLPYQIQYKRAKLVFMVYVFVVIPHYLTYPRWSPHYLPERPRHSPATGSPTLLCEPTIFTSSTIPLVDAIS